MYYIAFWLGVGIMHLSIYVLVLRTLHNLILRIARNFLETMENIKNILPYKFGPILMGIKQKKKFYLKKKINIADSKKMRFSKSPILKKISRKFHRSVLGLVGLIDAKGINMAQPIWP